MDILSFRDGRRCDSLYQKWWCHIWRTESYIRKLGLSGFVHSLGFWTSMRHWSHLHKFRFAYYTISLFFLKTIGFKQFIHHHTSKYIYKYDIVTIPWPISRNKLTTDGFNAFEVHFTPGHKGLLSVAVTQQGTQDFFVWEWHGELKDFFAFWLA